MFRSLAARPPRQLDPPPHFGAACLRIHPQYRHGSCLHRRSMGRPVPSLRCSSLTSLGCRSNCALPASDAPLRAHGRCPSFSNTPLATRHRQGSCSSRDPGTTPIRPVWPGTIDGGDQLHFDGCPPFKRPSTTPELSLQLSSTCSRVVAGSCTAPGIASTSTTLLSLSGPAGSRTPAFSHSPLTFPAVPIQL